MAYIAPEQALGRPATPALAAMRSPSSPTSCSPGGARSRRSIPRRRRVPTWRMRRRRSGRSRWTRCCAVGWRRTLPSAGAAQACSSPRWSARPPHRRRRQRCARFRHGRRGRRAPRGPPPVTTRARPRRLGHAVARGGGARRDCGPGARRSPRRVGRGERDVGEHVRLGFLADALHAGTVDDHDDIRSFNRHNADDDARGPAGRGRHR